MIVAGGIGLAPLRPALLRALAAARAARRPRPALRRALARRSCSTAPSSRRWRADPRLDVGVTVDSAEPGWRGHVGVVTTLIGDARFDPGRAVAFVVGPEVMMRFTVEALLDRGMDPADIHVSIERNMKCAVTHCGRCQFGPTFACREGAGDELSARSSPSSGCREL